MHILAVIDSRNRLELDKSELECLHHLKEAESVFLEHDLAHKKLDFTDVPLKNTDVLHVTKHCVPTRIFTDPAFSSTSTAIGSGIELESIQREAHNLSYSLVFLNGCNTATSSNWNYFKHFQTNEQISLLSTFLLNQKSSVIATHWNLVEVLGFVFTFLFYRHFFRCFCSDRAFALAISDLYDLTREEAIEVVNQIANTNDREKRVAALRDSPLSHPFRSPYCTGVYSISSLIRP